MKLDRDIVILDLELHQPYGEECDKVAMKTKFDHAPHKQILEIGAIRLNRDGTVSDDKFEIIVKQNTTQISPFIQELTGITQEMVDSSGVEVETALTQFHAWVFAKTTNTLLTGWGDDAEFIHRAMFSAGLYHLEIQSHRKEDIRPRVHTMAALLHCVPRKRAGLQAYLRAFGLEYDPRPQIHRAYSDAYNTGKLFEAAALRHTQVSDNLRKSLQLLGVD